MLPGDTEEGTTTLAVTEDRLPLVRYVSPKAGRVLWEHTDKLLLEELEETTEDLVAIRGRMVLTDLSNTSKKLAVLTILVAVVAVVTTGVTVAQAMPEGVMAVANPILPDILLRLIQAVAVAVLLNITGITMAVLAAAES